MFSSSSIVGRRVARAAILSAVVAVLLGVLAMPAFADLTVATEVHDELPGPEPRDYEDAANLGRPGDYEAPPIQNAAVVVLPLIGLAVAGLGLGYYALVFRPARKQAS